MGTPPDFGDVQPPGSAVVSGSGCVHASGCAARSARASSANALASPLTRGGRPGACLETGAARGRDPPASRPIPETRRARGLIAGGGVSLGLAGVGLLAVRAYRLSAYEDYVGLVTTAGQAGGKTPEQAAQLEASKEIKAPRSRC